MAIENFILLTIIVCFSLIISIEGRHRRDLTDNEHYHGIYGDWYIMAILNGNFNASAIKCARRKIFKTDYGRSLEIDDTFQYYGKNMRNMRIITELEPNIGIPVVTVTRFKYGEEIFFEEKASNKSLVLLSRDSKAENRTIEEFKNIAQSLHLADTTINNDNCA